MPSGELYRPKSIDPSTWSRLKEPCIHLRTPAQPVVLEGLRRVGQIFCRLRGEHTEWKIIGGGSRSPDLGLRLFIRRCLHRPRCTIPTGSLQLRARGHIIKDGSGNWVPRDPRLRNVRDENTLVRALLPLIPVPRSGHGAGLAVDMWCSATTSAQQVYVPCQLLVERAFKEAGFCRLNNEWWHYELNSHRTSRQCNPNWQIGVVRPYAAERGASASRRAMQVNYAQTCAEGRFSYRFSDGKARCRPGAPRARTTTRHRSRSRARHRSRSRAGHRRTRSHRGRRSR